jgi:S1-C subfamily serine protease
MLNVYGQWNNNSSHHDNDRAFMGISDREVDYGKALALEFPNKYGSYIKYVYQGTAAEAAGIQPFDYIYAIDGKEMNRSRDLTDLLREYRPGDQVQVKLIRKGQDMTIPMTLGRPEDSNSDHKGGSAFLGVREHDRNDDDEIGVRITTVRNSTAIALGLDDGDVITAINGYPMVDWGDISVILNNMNSGDPITVEYLRNDQPQRASGTIGDEESCRENNERGFIGIYPGHMDRTKANALGFDNPYGSYIKRVIPGSGAEAAGLEPLDYIVAVNDIELSDERSLTSALKRYGPGDKVTVYFMREGRELETEVVLQGESHDNDYSRPCSEEPFFGVSANHNGRNSGGVNVNIVKNSAAQAAGLQSGDIITSMNAKPLYDWSDLSGVINGTDVGQRIEIAYLRNGQEGTTTATMGSECDESGRSRNENNWYDYNYDDSFDDNSSSRADEPAVDMNRIQVDMADMEPNEAREMASKGVDMPLINNLTIENIQLFPNPNRGMFRLEFELPQRGETSIRVFNSDARLIYSFDLGEYQGVFSDDIDISQNGAGSYFLEVRQGVTSMVKKIILQY